MEKQSPLVFEVDSLGPCKRLPHPHRPSQVLNSAAPSSCGKTGADTPERGDFPYVQTAYTLHNGERGGSWLHVLMDWVELEPQQATEQN